MRSTMLCLSGFELCSRWVPLMNNHYVDVLPVKRYLFIYFT